MEEKTYTQIKKEFVEKYKTVILPVLRSYDEERKKEKMRVIKIRIICILVIILAFKTYFTNWMMIVVAAICAMFGCGFYVKKSFEEKIKYKIMPAICRCFGDLKWSFENYENTSIFGESNLIPSYANSTFDDIFKGSWKDIEFEIIESAFFKECAMQQIGVFAGIIIKLEMNKEFKSHTVIRADTLAHWSPDSTLQRTELEDVVFEKQFDVFTNDPIDARYLITTAFMERVNNLAEVFNLKISSIAFFKNNFLIAFEATRDMFDLCNLNKSLFEHKDMSVLIEEILSIYKLIDYFEFIQKTDHSSIN